MPNDEVLNIWLDALKAHQEPEGFPIMPGVVKNDEGELAMLALAVSPDEAWKVINDHIGNPSTCEAIFGVDRYSKPGQGIEEPSLITVYWWRREHEGFYGWKTGVLPYDTQLKPIIWDHPFWKPIQIGELKKLFEDVRDDVRRRVEALGVPADVADELALKLAQLGQPFNMKDAVGVMTELLARYRKVN